MEDLSGSEDGQLNRNKRPEALSRKLTEMNLNNLLDNDSDDIMEFVDSILKAEFLLDENNKLKPDVSVNINEGRYSFGDTHSNPADSDAFHDPSTSYQDEAASTEKSLDERSSDKSTCDIKNVKRKHAEGDSGDKKPAPLRLGDCAVCLESLVGKEIASTLCGHVFCLSCLNNVAVQLRRCPICRKKIFKSKIIRLHL